MDLFPLCRDLVLQLPSFGLLLLLDVHHLRLQVFLVLLYLSDLVLLVLELLLRIVQLLLLVVEPIYLGLQLIGLLLLYHFLVPLSDLLDLREARVRETVAREANLCKGCVFVKCFQKDGLYAL